MQRWSISYRPKRFEEVIGQEHVLVFFKTVLGNYWEKETTLPVGVLFGGHSGVGKTTVARVIAASLNCDSRDGVEPCGKCESCSSIIGGSGGVMEIDASFFGLVDNIRSLRDQLLSYSFAEYQVVIIDECHMLSREASNVLLKLLEEPPKNVLFIMCTTEVNKLLDTVRSRLVEFRFSLIPPEKVVSSVQKILRKEEIVCEDELVERLYKLSKYNVRDVLVALEQLSLLGEREITPERMSEVYGDVYVFERLVKALRLGKFADAMQIYQGLVVYQPDFKSFVEGLVVHLGDSLRETLVNGSPASVWYSFALKKVYEFLQKRIVEFGGAAGVRLLLFQLIPEDKQCAVEAENIQTGVLEKLSDEEIFELLTEG
jgi:DNA polymerase-3 subunit gamma/tau